MKDKNMNTMNYLKRTALGISVLTVLFTGCKKNNEREILLTQEITGVKGIYILNEGTMGAGNSTISYYDVAKKTVVNDFYKQANGSDKKLGETANDLKVYGSKMYCAILGDQTAGGSFVEIMDVNTGKTLKRIAFGTATNGYMPRSIAFHKNKAYISRVDGKISRIDTASLNVEAELQLKNGTDDAAGLDGSAVVGDKLYIAGSDYYGRPTSYKNKVIVVNLNTFTKVKEITVNNNPNRLVANDKGELFVTTAGVYGGAPSALQKINTSTDEVSSTENTTDLGSITFYKDQAWTVINAYSAGTASAKSINVATGKIGNNLITDGTVVSLPYGLTVNPYDQSIVVSDAIGFGTAKGKAFVFSKEGKKLHEFETGTGPQAAAFVYTYKYVYKSL